MLFTTAMTHRGTIEVTTMMAKTASSSDYRGTTIHAAVLHEV